MSSDTKTDLAVAMLILYLITFTIVVWTLLNSGVAWMQLAGCLMGIGGLLGSVRAFYRIVSQTD